MRRKKLTEGIDYVVRYVAFPNCEIDGAIVSHPDIACIYINTNVCQKRQIMALKHELEHLAKDDLYSDEPTYIIEDRMND